MNSLLQEHYRGKDVLVTGGRGFVGNHLVRELVDAGANVVVIDDFSRGTGYVPGALYHRADLREHTSATLFKGAQVVFNLAAAVAGVVHNQSHHLQMFDDNIRLQTCVAEACRRWRVERVIHFSSVCVYSPEHNAPAMEENAFEGHPIAANEGYSWSKRMGELAFIWAELNWLAIARPNNVFGPGDYYDEKAHVIPALIHKAHKGELVLHGSGKQVREFIYVLDVVNAALLIGASSVDSNRAYNIGANGFGGLRTSIIDLANQIRDMVSATGALKIRGSEWATTDADGGDDERFSNADLLASLGFVPKTPLHIGLLHCIADYRRSVAQVNE